jgi:adenylate cyclase
MKKGPVAPIARQWARGAEATFMAGKDPADFDRREADQPRWVQPIRVHLSFLIVALLVVIAVPLMLLTYQQGRTAAITAADQQMRLLGRHTIDSYRSLFYDGFSTVKIAMAMEPLTTPPPADLDAKKEFLVAALEGSPFIDGIYAGYPDGSFIHAVNLAVNPRWEGSISPPKGAAFALRTIENLPDGGRRSTWRFLAADHTEVGQRATDEVNYDPRRRPWYRAALSAGAPVSVGPYVSAATKSLSLTLAAPTHNNPQIVVGIDVLLETISGILAKEAVSARATGYIFDREKKLIVHSDKAIMDQILSSFETTPKSGDAAPEIVDPTVEPVRELLRQAGAPANRTVQFAIGAEPYLAQISNVAFSDLVKGNTVIIAAPLSDFIDASVKLLRRTLLIAGAVLIGGILAALGTARIVSRALIALAGEARQIGNLETERPVRAPSWIVEINTLGHALDSAREAIATFALYVPRELVRRIVSSGQASAGQAMRQEVTIMFTDIRDFTTISEQHSPEAVVDLLSDYFELANATVERHNGVIVQYLGDSVYAMWNAPTPDPSHAADACRCALALKAEIDDYNRKNREGGRPELVTRFGVHSGIAVVGSVGAETRRQYTGMGDTVNVASRLEGMNKQYGTTILVSSAVRDRCEPGAFGFRSLGFAQAKGRTEQLEVFELTPATE